MSFLHLVPWLIDAKYKPLNYAFASTILTQSKVLLEASPVMEAEKVPGFEKLMRRGYDKRRQADPEQYTVRLCPLIHPLSLVWSQYFYQTDWLKMLRQGLTGNTRRQITPRKDDVSEGKQSMCGTESKKDFSFVYKSLCCMNEVSIQ